MRRRQSYVIGASAQCHHGQSPHPVYKFYRRVRADGRCDKGVLKFADAESNGPRMNRPAVISE